MRVHVPCQRHLDLVAIVHTSARTLVYLHWGACEDDLHGMHNYTFDKCSAIHTLGRLTHNIMIPTKFDQVEKI